MAVNFVDANASLGYLTLESRPQRVVAAVYDALPFPKVGTQQELAFDLGITALAGDADFSKTVEKSSSVSLCLSQLLPRRSQSPTPSSGAGQSVAGYYKLTNGIKISE